MNKKVNPTKEERAKWSREIRAILQEAYSRNDLGEEWAVEELNSLTWLNWPRFVQEPATAANVIDHDYSRCNCRSGGYHNGYHHRSCHRPATAGAGGGCFCPGKPCSHDLAAARVLVCRRSQAEKGECAGVLCKAYGCFSEQGCRAPKEPTDQDLDKAIDQLAEELPIEEWPCKYAHPRPESGFCKHEVCRPKQVLPVPEPLKLNHPIEEEARIKINEILAFLKSKYGDQ